MGFHNNARLGRPRAQFRWTLPFLGRNPVAAPSYPAASAGVKRFNRARGQVAVKSYKGRLVVEKRIVAVAMP
jgi:hypothetical protein